MRKQLVIAVGVLILVLTNHAISSRENLVNNGQRVLLELAPVDPRSLMQGDYMALNFEVARHIVRQDENEDERIERIKAADGHIILSLDQNHVASFVRMDDGQGASKNEIIMRYRIRNYQVKFGTNAFFFQEGTAQIYEAAQYGEFRVDEKGDAILVALYDENLAMLEP